MLFCQTPPNAIFMTNTALWASTWQNNSERRMLTHTLYCPAGGPRRCLYSAVWPRAVISAAVCAAVVIAAVGSVNLILLTQMILISTCLLKTWKLRCSLMRETAAALSWCSRPLPQKALSWPQTLTTPATGQTPTIKHGTTRTHKLTVGNEGLVSCRSSVVLLENLKRSTVQGQKRVLIFVCLLHLFSPNLHTHTHTSTQHRQGLSYSVRSVFLLLFHDSAFQRLLFVRLSFMITLHLSVWKSFYWIFMFCHCFKRK